jgi:hypothetical protein
VENQLALREQVLIAHGDPIMLAAYAVDIKNLTAEKTAREGALL